MVFKLAEGSKKDFSVLAFGGALPLGTSSVAPEKACWGFVVQMENDSSVLNASSLCPET